jgi:hypothetical protein
VGQVVDAKQRPVAGADIWVSGLALGILRWESAARATSDGEGRFRLTVPAPKDGRMSDLPWAAWATRAGHSVGGRTFTHQSIAKAKGEPFVVKLGAPGDSVVRVLDPDGRAVVGAKVFPMTVHVETAPGTRFAHRQNSAFHLPDELAERLAATTGPDGRGTIADVAPADLGGVLVDSTGRGRQQAAPTRDSDGSFVIQLAAVGRLTGRIIVDDPKALKGLRLGVFTLPGEGGNNASAGRAQAVLDSSGRFEVPALPVGSLYLTVQVPEGSALKFITPRNKLIEAGKLTEVTITEEKPPRTRTLSGSVVDTKGMPVVGATVFQTGDAPARTETTSDAEGRFSLPGVADVPTFVFAHARGFRFVGRSVPAGETEAMLTLTRENERPAETMKTLAPSVTPEQQIVAAHRLIDAYATKALEKGDMNDKIQVLSVLARVDPARTLELTDGKTLAEPFLKGMIRLRVSVALVESAPDEALAVAESIDDPAARTQALLNAVDAVPATEKAKKQELLDRALLSAKAAREPTGVRMLLTGQVAERWLDMGLTEKGTALLREFQRDAAQLPDAAWPAYAKGIFAEELCQVDLDAALKLTKGLSDAFEYDRHHGNIAHELAGKDPAAAERVLGMVKQPYQHDDYVVRVVYRMAPIDLARARRLAATTVDPVMRGYAFGMGALGLAQAKKTAEATVLLREALEILGSVRAQGESPTRSPCERASACAALVAVAEQVDPDLVPETFWRALSLRYPRPPGTVNDLSCAYDPLVGMLLARYNRDVARELVAHHVGREASEADLSAYRGLAFAAAAVVDPAWVVQIVESLPDDADFKTRSTKNSARLTAAAALARTGEARWRYLLHHYAYLWVADTEDLAPDL